MSLFQPIAIRSLFWLLAWSPLLYLHVGYWAPCGGLAATAFVSSQILSKWRKRVLKYHSPASSFAAAMAITLVGWFVSAPGIWISLGCELGMALTIHQIILGFSLVLGCIAGGQCLDRWPLARLAEALCMTWLLGAIFAAHRHGMIQQPGWMVDVFVEHNWNMLHGLRSGGLIAAMTGMLYLVLSALAAGEGGGGKRFTMLLAGIAVAWVVSDRVGAPPLNPPRIEPPPLSSDLPPPPPPPDRVALVIFEDWFRPSQEILFSTAQVGKIDVSSAQGKTIRSEVHLLGESPAVPALIRAVSSESLKPKKPFAASYRIVSTPPSGDPTEILGPEELGDTAWGPEDRKAFVEVQPHQKMETLVTELMKEEPLFGGKIAKVKDWLEKQIPVSEKAGAKDSGKTLQNLITSKDPCGMEQLSRALVDMLRRAGIPARLNEGFVYAPGPEFKKEILLTSQHRQHWAEVYLAAGGWTPLALHPENVLDKTDPPPQPDLEDLLARLSEQGDPEHVSATANPAKPPMTTLLQILFAALFGLALHPLLLVLSRRSSLLSLRHQLRILRLSGLTRGFGESWDEFIIRTGSRSLMCARAVRSTLEFVMAASEPDAVPARIAPAWQALKLWFILPWLLIQRMTQKSKNEPASVTA